MLDLHKNLLIIITALALSSCAALVPKEHLIPKERLISAMQKKFPLYREKGGGRFSVEIAPPQLNMIPGQNRVSLDGEFTAKATFIKVEGHFIFSSALRYDSKQSAVFLQEARFDSFELKHGNKFAEEIRPLINRMMTELIKIEPIYRFQPDELVVWDKKIDVAGIDVIPEGIMLKIKVLQ